MGMQWSLVQSGRWNTFTICMLHVWYFLGRKLTVMVLSASCPTVRMEHVAGRRCGTWSSSCCDDAEWKHVLQNTPNHNILTKSQFPFSFFIQTDFGPFNSQTGGFGVEAGGSDFLAFCQQAMWRTASLERKWTPSAPATDTPSPTTTTTPPPSPPLLPRTGRVDNLSRSFRVGGLQLSNA